MKNQFIEAIRNFEPQLGIWNSVVSPIVTEMIASAGFDWTVCDMEHAPNEIPIVVTQLMACAGEDIAALVRPPSFDAVVTKRLLDIGTQTLLFPMIDTPKEAREVVRATRYPPQGIRGVAGAVRASRYGRDKDYLREANDTTGVIVQIETELGLQNVEEIAATNGIDGIFFGPSDISASLGLLGQPTHPKVWEVIFDAVKKVKAAGKPSGTLVLSTDHASEVFRNGMSFVACMTDTMLINRGLDAILNEVKR